MGKDTIKREDRQKRLANLFYEMGMDLDLVEQISKVSKEEIMEMQLKKKILNEKANFFNCEWHNHI